MRTIDADDLRRNIDKSYPFDRDTQRKHDAYDIAKGMLLVIIDKQPTVEPQRMRGRWIDKSEGRIEGAWPYCSVCDNISIQRYDFCPDCGADMRGDSNG